MNKTLAKVLHSGLHSQDDEPYFSWRKCEVCGGLAGNRYTVKGFTDLKSARANDYIEFEACEKCLYEAAYGERETEA